MEQVLLVVQILLAAALIGMVLLQRSDSDGFGLGSGSGANLLSGRATANLMTRTTAIIAALFILNSLALSVLAAHGRAPSITETIKQQETDEPSAPAVPTVGATEKTDKGAVMTKDTAKEAIKESTPLATPTKASVPVMVKKKPAAKPAVPTDNQRDEAPADNE